MPRIEPRLAQGSELLYYASQWPAAYNAVWNAIGRPNSATLLPFGDPFYGQPNATTFTSKQWHDDGEQAAWTWSKAPNTFDTPLVLPTEIQGTVPTVTFDGVDEEADAVDAAYWSRASGTFSIIAWVNLTDATSSTILSKYDTVGSTREWIWWFDGSDKLQLLLYDEDDGVGPNASIDSEVDVASAQGIWICAGVSCTDDADPASIDLYINGAIAASTDTDDANFTQLRDKGGTVKLAHTNATPGNLFEGSIASGPCGLIFTQTILTAAHFKNYYDVTARLLGLL